MAVRSDPVIPQSAAAMKLSIDTEARSAEIEDASGQRTLDLYAPEVFREIAALWVKTGWAQRYSYGFTWLGRPVIQLPEDLMRLQEVLWRLKPDVIVETGVAHGGSAVFFAGLCHLAGKGRVIAIDIDVRAPNRSAIEAHPLFERITLIEGDSAAAATVDAVKAQIYDGEAVFVFLDGNHAYDHVAAELRAYGPLVTPGSYIVAADAVMRDLHDVPGGQPGWKTDNPANAAKDFAARNPAFALAPPPRAFDETATAVEATYLPSAWLRRLESGDSI